MKTNYVNYLETIKQYNPVDYPNVELEFELSYEYEVLTIFNTLYEIGYTDFSKIKFEFIENEGTFNIYKCSGIVSTHMDISEGRDFLNWRKEYLETKKQLDDLWTNKISKPKPKVPYISPRFIKVNLIKGIIGIVLVLFSIINLMICFPKFKLLLTSPQNGQTIYFSYFEMFVFYGNLPIMVVGVLLVIRFILFLLIKNDKIHILHRRYMGRKRLNFVVSYSNDNLNETDSKTNVNEIKEKYNDLKAKMPSWYHTEAFKFYYRDVYLLDKKLFDF